MRERRLGLAIIALLLVGLAAHPPKADIRIVTQDRSDPAPHRFQAAVDLGVVGISLLWTWSGHRLIDDR